MAWVHWAGWISTSVLLSLLLSSSPFGLPLAEDLSASLADEGVAREALEASLSRGGCFVENRGQVREGISYYSVGDPSFGFTPTGVMILLRDGEAAHAVAMNFAGAHAVEPKGSGEVCYWSHFLRGERSAWVQAVPAYPVLRYRDLYGGIDLVYRWEGGLKAEFIVRPGADPGAVTLRYEAAMPSLDAAGNLVLQTPTGSIVDAAPFVYQESSGREAVWARYVLDGAEVRFELGAYDRAQTLILDPLIYATYAGGFDADRIEGLAVDADGFAYVTGTTFSTNFPTTAGAYDLDYSGQEDVFVAKLNPDGTGFVYATFLGGSSWEFGHDIALADAGQVLVAGATASADFPTTPGAFAVSLSGCCDAFVAKLNAEGSDLVFSTFLGGAGGDAVWSLVLDEEGTPYLVGDTSSANFPVTNESDDQTPNGSRDAFVARLSADGRALLFGTYLGGSGFELGYGIGLDPAGGVWVTGLTTSFDFRGITTTAYDRGFNGGEDVFLVQYDARGVRHYGTYFGGADDDRGRDVTVDPRGFVYVTGATSSANLPVSLGAADRTYNGGSGDAFVARFYPGGRGLAYSTYLGGIGMDRAWAVVVDAAGTATVTGRTQSSNFPVTPNAFDEGFNGPDPDVFVSQLSPEGTTLFYSTFVGGSGWDQGWSITRDAQGATYVVGETDSPEFPATAGAFDESLNGLLDGFVFKLSIPQQTIVLDLISPWNYGAIPPGTPIRLAVSGPGVTTVSYTVDEGPPMPLLPPYRVDTSSWENGTHILRAEVQTEGGSMAERAFVLFIDPTLPWPPDTVPVDVVLVGFDLSPSFFETQLRASYTVTAALRPDETDLDIFSLQFAFRVQAANATYHQGLLDHLRASATYRDTLQARLNITALVDQRDTGVARDIFDPLVGWEIPAEAAETYLMDNPPVPLEGGPGYTFYVLNLSALDDITAGEDHWFVDPTLDPDTGRIQDWWRLEWDNALNTPMGYPLNTWGGPGHRVFVDPTAYQWYLDWSHVWWEVQDQRAPYGLQFEEVPVDERPAYLAAFLNDLVGGLAATLPQGPPTEPAVRVQNLVLSGSVNYTLDELDWVASTSAFETYLRGFLPFKDWVVNTTFARIQDFPALRAVVDANTQFVGNQGSVNGVAVWSYLSDNREGFLPDDPDVFEILSVNLLYDDRSFAFGGLEFTGLGGGGITVILMKTARLFDESGMPQKGLTSILSHETGHNLGYGHQFGSHWRADFVEGNQGYFRNDLTYGPFWEDALRRVYVREKLRTIQQLLEARDPLDLGPEFLPFYAAYRDQDFLAAFDDLVFLEAMLTDTEPPVAVLAPDRTVEEDQLVTLDATASRDNFRILTYNWDFDDGTTATTDQPEVAKTWTRPGVYQVQLTVFDAAGNQGSATQTLNVLDLTQPFLLITAPDPTVEVNAWDVPIGWQASDEGLGLDRFELSLDGGPVVVLEGEARSHVFPLVADGSHFVTLTAFDASGNQASTSLTFRVQTGFLSPTKPYGLMILFAIGVSASALAGLLVYRSRRRRKET